MESTSLNKVLSISLISDCCGKVLNSVKQCTKQKKQFFLQFSNPSASKNCLVGKNVQIQMSNLILLFLLCIFLLSHIFSCKTNSLQHHMHYRKNNKQNKYNHMMLCKFM